MHGRLMVFNFVVLFFLLALTPRQSVAQDSAACPDLVLQAIQTLEDNCGNLSRNTACYGYNRVSAVFSQDQSADFFSKPADQSDLKIMQSIQTAPLDTVLNQWGVAVMNVQANIPNTLPGQGARFVLLGDTAVNNDVPPDEGTQTAVEPVTVTTSTGANIRSVASTRANVLSSVPAGTDVQADAVSTDGNWLRVTYTDTLGWMSRDVIQANDALNGLPTIGDQPRSPMQAFHFRTGPGQTFCDDAPSVLVVQGPDNVQVSITANGADIQIGSTIVLTTGNNQLKLTTIHGEAKVDGVRVPAGFSVEAPLSSDNNVNGDFGGFHYLTQSERDMLKVLEKLPSDTLNYPIKLPPLQQIIQQTPGTSTVTALANGKVDCGPFKATSPLDGLAFGVNTFYWDAAPGATSYRVTVSGVGTVETTAPTTNAILDLTSAGFNPQMSWSVEALLNGQTACVSAPVTIARQAPPPAPSVASSGTFQALWQCGGSGTFTVSYASLPAGTTGVTINYSDTGSHSPASGSLFSVPPLSNTINFNGVPGTHGGGGSIVAHPSGATVSLPALGFC